MSSTVRGVLIGLGVMGGYHRRVLATFPDVQMVTVDLDPARRAMCRTLSDALLADTYDFACIATPPDTLASLAHEALEAGLAVFVEKPLADRRLHAEGVVRDAANRGALLSVGYVERFNPAVLTLRDRLIQVGRIYEIHTRRLSPPPRRRSAGVTLDLATHDLDIMRWLTGEEPESISAEGVGGDLVCATLRFPGGTIGLLEANWLTPTKIRDLTIIGANGMFTLDYAAQELCFYERPWNAVRWEALAGIRGPGEGDMIRYAFERREPLVAQWEAFLEALRAGRSTPADGENALRTLALALNVDEAARQSHSRKASA